MRSQLPERFTHITYTAIFLPWQVVLVTMGDLRWIQMSEEEVNSFLGNGGTGILSFSTTIDESPYSLPVSYGYDAGAAQFYYRLSFLPNSGKEDVIDRPVSFIVHTHTDDGWRSVIATGTLQQVTDMPYDSSAVQGMWAVNIPFVDVFDRPREDVTFRQFRLVPDKLTGRKEVKSQN